MSKKIHALLAFVSIVTKRSIEYPVVFDNLQGKPYTAIQTNESAIVNMDRYLKNNGILDGLNRLFLIASTTVTLGTIDYKPYGTVNHLEFLKNRLKENDANVWNGDDKNFFSIHEYDDQETGHDALEKNLLQIASIAEAITHYSKEQNAELIVHADMTGGLRHGSMMMLAILQLLKYRGIKIGQILYCDQGKKIVYEATEIQNMFNLIAGANEFVNFGSVNSLLEYFSTTEITAGSTLDKLLSSMNRFSEAVKVCRTSAIMGELAILHQAIHDFRHNPGNELKASLFAKIIDTVEEEYGAILQVNANQLDVIRWCINKGFFQQALTLVSEWLPEFMFEHLCAASELARADAVKDGWVKKEEWEHHLLVSYNKKNSAEITAPKIKILRRAIITLLKTPSDKAAEQVCRQFDISPKAVAAKQSMVKHIENMSADKLLQEFNISEQNIVNYIYAEDKAVRDDYMERKNTTKANFTSESAKFDEFTAMKWPNVERNYRQLIAGGILTPCIEEQKILSFLHDYRWIVDKRNKINHAAKDATDSEQIDIVELMDKVNTYIDELDKASKNIA